MVANLNFDSKFRFEFPGVGPQVSAQLQATLASPTPLSSLFASPVRPSPPSSMADAPAAPSLNLGIIDACLSLVRFPADNTEAIRWLSENQPVLWKSPFFSVTRTDDEVSVIVEDAILADVYDKAGDKSAEVVKVENEWRLLKVQGPLDFALVGILAGLASTLAAAGVSIFAVSTYDTDYIMVKKGDLEKAIEALIDAGHNMSYKKTQIKAAADAHPHIGSLVA